MIFFDLDGTLLDYKGAEYLAAQAFYNEFRYLGNWNCSQNEFYEKWCMIAKKHYTRFLRGELSFKQQQIERVKELFNGEIKDHEAAELFQVYVENFERNWRPFDDVIPCLEKLDGHRLGVITNGELNQQKLKLERIGILDYFEVVVASGDVGFAKPDPRIFEIACEMTGTDLNEMMYIGDDVATDIVPCEACKITCIWINRRKERPARPVTHMITSLKELYKYLP
jgi:putative hydrolase of the HAD superfamily